MNDQIRWDPALAKKFSSTNHYKLLNQLKNEVKKYPLNNKKKDTIIRNKDYIKDSKRESNVADTQRIQTSNEVHLPSDNKYKESTVSFNNAKNFSIYNKSTTNISKQNECLLPDKFTSNDETMAGTFQDRLNKIDMK
tara:strand:+ start:147 stop:557 length:411 start_codon:yes stop_codon:yes gene_type:complete